jgi:hypothetical protein
MTPLDSPALTHRTADYPVRFWNAVPKRVRMNFDVAREMFITGAMPEWRDVVAVKGQEYPVYVSSEGYIAAIINGLRLPLKSWEFEVIQWHPLNCCSACGLPSGGRELCDGCVLDARDAARAQAEIVREDANSFGEELKERSATCTATGKAGVSLVGTSDPSTQTPQNFFGLSPRVFSDSDHGQNRNPIGGKPIKP